VRVVDAIIQYIVLSIEFIGTQLLIVSTYPFSSNQRIFWLYLYSAGIFAFYVYQLNTQSIPAHKSSFRAFIDFLFPKEVWRNPSAWLDVRYFFFHQVFRVVIYGAFSTGALNVIFQIVTGWPTPTHASKLTMDSALTEIAISTAYMFVFVGLGDFVAYAAHYLQHKVPFLWEFHKVHHSLEVRHPLSNYREHPIDNIFYAAAFGATYGLIMGVASNVYGYVPSMPQLLGIPLLVFAFNILGYNLRHSHVWVRWPGRWSMVFGSPAHHHIHHSCHPDHLDKNFAFIFPIWDVLFGTYELPETNKDVRFGIAEGYANEFKSCLGIYFIPFKNLWLRITGGRQLSTG
jgi:sterol desaturase/sphingolipid hydroxylase (fatty acid hydroxylase superfamily)